MRFGAGRLVACASAGLLLAGLMGCGGGRMAVTVGGRQSAEVAVGDELALSLIDHGPGCGRGGSVSGARTWVVKPATGAKVSGRWFVATQPGVYEITTLEPPANERYAKPAIVYVGGVTAEMQAAEPEEVKPAPKPKPKPAKKAPRIDTSVAKRAEPDSIEFVFANVNRSGVRGGGDPPEFTLVKKRRIRLLESYHLDSDAPAGGSFTLKTSDGTTYGPFKTNRVEASKGGIPNAYWYADVNFELPAGTYRFIDSDPETWSQNAQTDGTGFCAVSALKE